MARKEKNITREQPSSSAVKPGQQPVEPASIMDSIQAEVTPETSPLLNFIIRHGKKIFLTFGVLIVIVLAAGVFTWQADKKRQAMQEEIGSALTLADPAARLAALSDLAGKVPDSDKVSVLLALTQEQEVAKDYAAATASWAEIASRTAAGKGKGGPEDAMHTTALFGQAVALAMQDKTAEAIALLEELTKSADPYTRYMSNLRISSLSESVGDFPRALAAHNAIMADKDLESVDKTAHLRKIGELERAVGGTAAVPAPPATPTTPTDDKPKE